MSRVTSSAKKDEIEVEKKFNVQLGTSQAI